VRGALETIESKFWFELLLSELQNLKLTAWKGNQMYQPEKPVLLVIDMQNGFLGEKSRHIISNVFTVATECERRSIPIVFTKFHNREGSPYETLIGWRRLRSKAETNITEELSTFSAQIIDKNFYTAFTDAFEQMLKENGWKTLILCGVATESCVMKTAVDAFERNLAPVVISDACASHAGVDVHNAGLVILVRFIGKDQLVTTAEFFRHYDSFVKNNERESSSLGGSD
jgi:nicotinamidase-related amidase